MKGSEFDREVLVKRPNAELDQVTLKDTDFFKTEQKVFITPDLSQCCDIPFIYSIRNDLISYQGCAVFQRSKIN